MVINLRQNQILIISILSVLIYYTLFLKCFFPVKLSREGFANRSSLPLAISNHNEYDHIVLVIIDAMRSDFIYDVDTHMIFTRDIIRRGHGLNFTAKVNPPTVTLPRIKALTTGGIPGFVDVVLNFGSGELTEDNIITQLNSSGHKVVFYGDDTWLRLFPHQFARQEGTTSFFVTDYTEVDNNVTRHLPAELQDPDWRFMVLHYLGLDHIGHIAGPYSPLIKPKLQEMDNVIKQIYSQMEVWERNGMKSLLVVCGDHGMSDQGGHGGATPAETHVPVLFLSPSFKNENKEMEESEILQIDLAATLSTLLSVPIPLNNLGTVILDLLVDYNTEEKVDILFYNAQEVAHLLEYSLSSYDKNQGFILFNQTIKRHKEWLEAKGILSPPAHHNIGKSLIRNYKKSTQMMREQILETSTVYDVHGMIVAILFLWMILVLLLLRVRRSDNDDQSSSINYSIPMICIGGIVFCHVTVCTSQYGSQTLCSSNLASVFLQLIGFINFIWLVFQLCCLAFSEVRKHQYHIKRSKPTNIVEWWLLVGTVIHTLSLLSSSFVEEEHQTWYFYVVTLHLLLMWHSFCEQRQIYKPMNNTKKLLVVQERTSTTESETFNNELKEDECATSNFKDRETERLIGVFPKGFVKCVSAIAVVLIILRLCRFWNQTGNKWLDIPDLGDWLVRPENKEVLSILTGVSLIAIFILQADSSLHNNVVLAGGLLSTYCYRVSTSSLSSPIAYKQSKGVLEARISFLCTGLLGLDLIYHTFYREIKLSSPVITCKKIQRIWIAFMLLVLRPHNISLVALFVITEKLIYYCAVHHFKLTAPYITLFCYWMGQAAHFYQGNSNSLTTIDVSAGYIGLDDYQPVIIGVLMFLSTYGGVIFWLLSLIKYLFSLNMHRQDFVLASETLMVTKCLPLAVYTALVTLQRYHLFVWTVFSPKVLYEAALLLLVSSFAMILLVMSQWKELHDTVSKSE